MNKEFKYLGVSYKKAELSFRESISLNEEEKKILIQKVKEVTGCEELLIISTCNRTGVYYSFRTSLKNEILSLWGIVKQITDLNTQEDLFVEINDHIEASNNLFRVSMGLDSQVIGDLQISNQFKRAYQTSADEDACGPFLHRIMHSVFYTNKRVVQETAYRDGTASVSYAAVDLAKELCASFKTPKILLVGLGEIGREVASNLRDAEFAEVTLMNRTWETTNKMATDLKMSTAKFEDLNQEILNHHVIISTVQTEKPIICQSTIDAEELGLKYFIDLSVPRSIDENIGEIQGTLLYNIDNINSQTSKTIEKRIAAIPKVEAIIEQSMDELHDWEQEMEVSPTINKLKNALEDIRQKEINKHIKELNPQNLEQIDAITRGMMQKIMKLPVLQLKAACKRGEAETLIDILNGLFDLEKQEVN